MIYKFTLSMSGNELSPENIIGKTHGEFHAQSFHKSTDRRRTNSEDTYGYGSISFWHNNKFAVDELVIEYEKAFVEFIEYNRHVFDDYQAVDIVLFLEIYYEGEQCNFEVLNKELLRTVATYHVALPVSVYRLGTAEYSKWESDIRDSWEARSN